MATDLSIYEGEDKTWVVTITDEDDDPIDVTDYTFLFVVKTHRTDSDDDAIIKKEITSHSNPAEGKTQITIDSADTANLSGDYLYDYQWIDSTAKRRSILKKASFIIEQRIGDNFT